MYKRPFQNRCGDSASNHYLEESISRKLKVQTNGDLLSVLLLVPPPKLPLSLASTLIRTCSNKQNEKEFVMIRWGIFLIVMGVGSFILPMMGMQFRLMSLFKEAQPAAGIIVAGLGVLLVVLGVGRNNAKQARALVMQQPMNSPYSPNMPPQQAAAMPATAQVGNCLRCSQPLWAGDAACRACGTPATTAPRP